MRENNSQRIYEKKNTFIINTIIDFVLCNPDILILIILLFSGIAILFLSYYKGLGQYGMGGAFLFAVIYYFVWRKFTHFTENSIHIKPKVFENSIKTRILSIFFIIIYCISLLLLYVSVYERSAIYFVLITIAYSILFYLIFNTINTVKSDFLILVGIIILSISVKAGRFFSHLPIPGNDTVVHLAIANVITENFVVPEFGDPKYVFAHLWHSTIALEKVFVGVSTSEIAFLAVTVLFTLFSTFIIYIICRKFFNSRVGLIAAILINILDMVIVRTVTNLNTSSYTHMFFLLMLYFIFVAKNVKMSIIMLSILFSECVFTHQLSTFAIYCTLMSIFIYTGVVNIFCKGYPHQRCLSRYFSYHLSERIKQLFATPVIITILIILSWAYTSGTWEDNSFFAGMVLSGNRQMIRIFNKILESGSSPDELAVYSQLFEQYDLISNVFYNFGYSLFLFITLIGILIYLKKSHRYDMLILIFPAGVLFFLIYPGTFMGLGMLLIPHRFISLLEILMIPFAAYAVYILSPRGDNSKVIKACTMLLISTVIFFLVTTPYINQNDALYCNERVYPTELKDSEIDAIYWMTTYHDSGVNYIDSLVLSRQLSSLADQGIPIGPYRSYSLNNFPLTKGKIDNEGCILIRNYIRTNKEISVSRTFGRGGIVENNVPLVELDKKENKIYSVNEGVIYI